MANKIKFTNNIDLQGNEMQHMVIHPVSILPPGVEGKIAYLHTDKQIHYYDGSEWKIVGSVQDIIGINPIVVTTSSGTYTISISLATQVNSGSMSAVDKTKLDNLILINDDTDVPHVPIIGHPVIVGSNVNKALTSADTWMKEHLTATRPHGELKLSEKDDDRLLGGILSSDTKVASQLAVKTYADNIATSSGRPAEPYLTGGINVSYPPNYAGGTIKKGDHFIIADNGGSVGPVTAKNVSANDSIIANKDAATNIHIDWTVIVASVTIPDATETVKGIIRKATQAEAEVGIEDNAAITPKTLQDRVNIESPKYGEKNILESNGTGVSITSPSSTGFLLGLKTLKKGTGIDIAPLATDSDTIEIKSTIIQGAINLDDLLDVDITTNHPVNNDVLLYDSTAGTIPWVNKALLINNLGNVDISSPTDGQALIYNDATSKWVSNDITKIQVNHPGRERLLTSGATATDNIEGEDKLTWDKKILDIKGTYKTKAKIVSGLYSLTEDDSIIMIDTTAGGVAITLLEPLINLAGARIFIKLITDKGAGVLITGKMFDNNNLDRMTFEHKGESMEFVCAPYIGGEYKWMLISYYDGKTI